MWLKEEELLRKIEEVDLYWNQKKKKKKDKKAKSKNKKGKDGDKSNETGDELDKEKENEGIEDKKESSEESDPATVEQVEELKNLDFEAMIKAERKVDLSGADIDLKRDSDPFSGMDSNKKREIMNKKFISQGGQMNFNPAIY